MKIGGEFSVRRWPQLQKRLTAGEEAAWKEAVQVLRDRIDGRYLRQARQLIDRPYSGFAVLSIDCAVIEALEQFRRGVKRTPPKESGSYFREFLTTTRLKKFFRKGTADLFYQTIRCGILHQAETKADSRVKRKPQSFVVRSSRSGKGIVINAHRFHAELERAFEDHATELVRGNRDLREAFIKKMGYIARTVEAADVISPGSTAFKG